MTGISNIPITVVVPAKNEEANLGRCLERLSRFTEVIVVDSSSTDKTPQIVENFGKRYINFEWNGQYPKKRNWLLLNHELANEWVLFLDADEFIRQVHSHRRRYRRRLRHIHRTSRRDTGNYCRTRRRELAAI